MWFKNLLIYRLPDAAALAADQVEERLAANALQRCGSFDMASHGWVYPHAEGRFLHTLGGQWLLALGSDEKLLPAAVVNQVAKEEAVALAEKQGFPVGRKQLRELRERVADELRPKAFTRRRTTWAWIDTAKGLLVVDAASENKATLVLEALTRSLAGFAARPLQTQRGAGSAMTEWVASGEAPAGFSIDRDLELRAADAGQATVRYVRHDLAGEEIAAHIAGGKTATRLGMTWNDRISFVLTEDLQVKRLAFLDILLEEIDQQGSQGDKNEDEMFDLNFALMSGELARLIADLSEALGGAADAG